MTLTTRTERLISAAAGLNTSLAEKLDESGLGFLAWVSPTGSRSPEENEVWHSSYGQNLLLRIIGYIFCIAVSSLKGILSFFTYKGFNYVHINKKSRILLVIPEEITDHSDHYGTLYLSEDKDFPIDKIVFSRSKKIGVRFTTFSYVKKVKMLINIGHAIIGDIFERMRKKELNICYIDILMTFLGWFLSQRWYFHVDLYYLIKNTASFVKPRYKALAAVHEMHFYSKIVWQVAREESLLGITGQHAMIIPEKLWYFPHEREIEANLAMPDIFFVYSEETKNLLYKNYPTATKFPLCHSSRFKGWLNGEAVSKSPEELKEKNKEFILFAGGLTPYDTTSLLEAIDSLLDIRHSGNGMKIRYRLHPHARIRFRDRMRISKAVRSKKIELSKNSLIEDLEKSFLVIGAYTMVLRQAALIGKPVLSICSSKYIHPSVLPGDEKWSVSAHDLSWDRITRQINEAPESMMKKAFIKDLGEGNTEFSTKLIYETCLIKEPKGSS